MSGWVVLITAALLVQ